MRRRSTMVTITPVAEQKIQELMKEEKDVVGLRIYVRGGGCHGYQYGMAFESKMPKSIMSTACRAPGSPSRTLRRRRRAAAAAHSAHKRRLGLPDAARKERSVTGARVTRSNG